MESDCLDFDYPKNVPVTGISSNGSINSGCTSDVTSPATPLLEVEENSHEHDFRSNRIQQPERVSGTSL